MRKTVLLIINIMLISISIVSCKSDDKLPKSNSLMNSDDSCMKPVIELAYPTGFGEPVSKEKERVLPSFPWEPQIKLFEKPENTSAGVRSMVIRHRNGLSDQIWLSYYVGNPEREFVAQYDLTSKKIVAYNSSNQVFLPRFIYSSSNGDVWGVAYDKETSQMPFLVQFNDSIKEFELVSKNKIYLPGDIAAIAKDENNLFWISFMKRDMQTGATTYTFLSYNVRKAKVIEYPSVSKISPSSLALAPDKRVWMVIYQEGRSQLAVFDPVSEAISIYQDNSRVTDGFGTEYLDSLTGLYFDQLGRLWVDDRGWFDFSSTKGPEWYRIIRSSVFIEEQIYSEKRFIWRRPNFMSQSSNGIYWFGSPVGTVSLDASKGKWCLFTTALSQVLEDAHSNLWLEAYGVLYKYSANQSQ